MEDATPAERLDTQPWEFVRVSMGGLAGTPWRLRQALQHPQDSWTLLPLSDADDDDSGEGSTYFDHFKATQTFDDFRRNVAVLPHSTSETVEIVLVGDFTRANDLIDWKTIMGIAEPMLGFQVKMLSDEKISAKSHGLKRLGGPLDAMSGRDVLQELKRRPTCGRSAAMVALTLHDVYAPGDVRIAGIADEPSRVSLTSIIPHVSEWTDEDRSLQATRRMAKLLVRESLTLLGMHECNLVSCINNPAPKGLDDLEFNFCPICLRKINWLTGKDLLDRYAILRAALPPLFPEVSIWLTERMLDVGMPTFTTVETIQSYHKDNKRGGFRTGMSFS